LCIAKLAHTQFRTGVTFGNPEWSCPMDGPPPLPLSVAKGCGQGFGRERTERQLVACAASRPLALGRNQGLRARGAQGHGCVSTSTGGDAPTAAASATSVWNVPCLRRLRKLVTKGYKRSRPLALGRNQGLRARGDERPGGSLTGPTLFVRQAYVELLSHTLAYRPEGDPGYR